MCEDACTDICQQGQGALVGCQELSIRNGVKDLPLQPGAAAPNELLFHTRRNRSKLQDVSTQSMHEATVPERLADLRHLAERLLLADAAQAHSMRGHLKGVQN